MTADVQSLSDEKLVEAVKTEIVDPYWAAHRQPGRCKVCGWPLVERADEGCVEGSCSMRPPPMERRWRPLADWDDCHMVIDAMRAKGWLFTMEDHPDLPTTVSFVGSTGMGVVDAMRTNKLQISRAVLMAALMAVRSEKGAE